MHQISSTFEYSPSVFGKDVLFLICKMSDKPLLTLKCNLKCTEHNKSQFCAAHGIRRGLAYFLIYVKIFPVQDQHCKYYIYIGFEENTLYNEESFIKTTAWFPVSTQLF